jgi:hypothetical protein
MFKLAALAPRSCAAADNFRVTSPSAATAAVNLRHATVDDLIDSLCGKSDAEIRAQLSKLEKRLHEVIVSKRERYLLLRECVVYWYSIPLHRDTPAVIGTQFRERDLLFIVTQFSNLHTAHLMLLLIVSKGAKNRFICGG